MIINLVPEAKEITEYEKEINVELIVNERPYYIDQGQFRYYVSFQHSDIVVGKFLQGKHGNGHTIDEALKDYAEEISEEILVLANDNGKEEKRISVPVLKHTKLLNK